MSRRLRRDTAVGRREAGSGKMHEDGAAPSPRAPAIVISEHGHEIVEFIGPRQPLCAPLARQPDEPVVVPIVGIVAPAVVWRIARSGAAVRGRIVLSAR